MITVEIMLEPGSPPDCGAIAKTGARATTDNNDIAMKKKVEQHSICHSRVP